MFCETDDVIVDSEGWSLFIYNVLAIAADILSSILTLFVLLYIFQYLFMCLKLIIVILNQEKESDWRYCNRCYDLGNGNGYKHNHDVISGCFNGQRHNYSDSGNSPHQSTSLSKYIFIIALLIFFIFSVGQKGNLCLQQIVHNSLFSLVPTNHFHFNLQETRICQKDRSAKND